MPRCQCHLAALRSPWRLLNALKLPRCKLKQKWLTFVFVAILTCNGFMLYSRAPSVVGDATSGVQTVTRTNTLHARLGAVSCPANHSRCINVTQASLRIFSAFWDDRATTNAGPAVRILAYADEPLRSDLHCCLQSRDLAREADDQRWTCTLRPSLTKIISQPRGADAGLHQYLHICRLAAPLHGSWSRSHVALVEKAYSGFNPIALGVVSDRAGRPKSFATCLVPKYEDGKNWFSSRLHSLEFVLLQELIGTDVMTVYVYEAEKERKMFDIAPHTLAIDVQYVYISDNMSNGSSAPAFPMGLVLNDCLLRHLDSYISILDHTELLVPRSQINLADMVGSLSRVHNTSSIGAYVFQTLNFYDETTLKTSSYLFNKNSSDQLPKIVRYRARVEVKRGKILKQENYVAMVTGRRVDHMTAKGRPLLIPGCWQTNVPLQFGALHRFWPIKAKKRKDLVVDPTMDKYVTKLLRSLHRFVHF